MPAERISIGQPTNESEKWAYDFLENNLPDGYLLITSVAARNLNGFKRDCDAIVVGKYAVYIVEIKGYTGSIDVSSSGWVSEGRILRSDPIGQVEQNARIVSGKIKSKLGYQFTPPFVQGVVFVTGGQGGPIEIKFSHEEEAVYTKENIIDALSDPDQLTTRGRPRPLVKAVTDCVANVVCNHFVARQKSKTIGDYRKVEKLLDDDGIEVWSANYTYDSLAQDYRLKILRLDSTANQQKIDEARERLKWEFTALKRIENVYGTPFCGRIIDDGEQLVLPIRAPRGQRLSSIDMTLDVDRKLEILKQVSNILQKIHQSHVYHRNLVPQNIFVDGDNNVELHDFTFAKQAKEQKTISPVYKGMSPWAAPELIKDPKAASAASDTFTFAVLCSRLLATNWPNVSSTGELLKARFTPQLEAEVTTQYPGFAGWLESALDMSSDRRPGLEDLFVSVPFVAEAEPFALQEGAEVNGKYELIECLGTGSMGEVWRSKHLLGDFDCALKFSETDDATFELAVEEFKVLRELYHPNVVRIFDMDLAHGSNQAYLSMVYLSGDDLEDLIESEESPSPLLVVGWLKQLVNALRYLHSLPWPIIHKDIKPANIVTDGDQAILIDFNISGVNDFLCGTQSHKCPLVETEMEWSVYADVWALAVTFYELVTGKPLFEDETNFDVELSCPCPAGFPKPVFAAIESVIRGGGQEASPSDYMQLFKLNEARTSTDQLPEALAQKYGITSKRQKTLVLAHLNLSRMDQPRAKTAVINEYYKTRGLPLSQDERKRYVAVYSPLKKMGVVRYTKPVKGKVVLTDEFIADFEQHQD